MRFLTRHQCNEVNEQLKITVLDKPGSGGANHLYMIDGYDCRKNHSCTLALPSMLAVLFQNGPIRDVGVNGVTNEALLAIVIDRMEAFQQSKYACQENEEALRHLLAAMDALHKRTRTRIGRGVEGTQEV